MFYRVRHPRERRQMEYVLRARKHFFHLFSVAHIVTGFYIDTHHLIPLLSQRRAQMRTDKPCAAGHYRFLFGHTTYTPLRVRSFFIVLSAIVTSSTIERC